MEAKALETQASEAKEVEVERVEVTEVKKRGFEVKEADETNGVDAEGSESKEVEATADANTEARQAAFEALKDEIDGVSSEEVVQRTIDMQGGAAIVQSVVKRDSQPERRVSFERLAASGFYDITLLARLLLLSLAAWFVRERQVSSQRRASHASVPEELVQQGQAKRATMVRVLGFWLGHVPEVASMLEFVRAGNGHQALAVDLRELARAYQRPDFRAAVTPGSPGYDPADDENALAIAETIIDHLGLGSQTEVELWSARSDRVWTLMRRDYQEHCEKGMMIFKGREDVSVTYPSLVTALRSAPVRRKRAEEPQGPVDEPADEAGEENDGDDSVNG